MKTTEKGNIGENLACEYLSKCGYIIIERNYRSKHGEIDIIAQTSENTVFVEVKMRDANDTERFGRPCIAVTKAKKKSIIFTAEIYILKNPSSMQPRFDIIEIYESDSSYKLKHMKSAFTL